MHAPSSMAGLGQNIQLPMSARASQATIRKCGVGAEDTNCRFVLNPMKLSNVRWKHYCWTIFIENIYRFLATEVHFASDIDVV